MKVHYINILFFALPLNILAHNKNKPHTTPRHTQPNRSLCECELYAPVNYDNDPQMKRVMQQFEDRTSQRLRDYDDRMVEKRKQCKERCDKESQKIILKDKLEKQMAQHFNTLQTDIQSDAIPTCVCEKSVADKIEKGCLRCGGVLGGGVAPSIGLLGGIGEGAISVLQPLALKAARELAIAEATDLATQEGMKAVILKIQELSSYFIGERGFFDLRPIVTPSTFNNYDALIETADKLFGKACIIDESKNITSSFCNSTICEGGGKTLKSWVKAGSDAFEKTLESQTPVLTEAKVGAVNTTYAGYHTSIIASIVAVVVIVLIMVIIYLILRYRRKKKMKKKLQYIKLLEE
ncbi:rifin [Plasmodium reichenowi]|uniref:Rifin n=1 Tax=Plasmodium reichenowi TaxID=5854 RepID=A0A060RM80_PLARE|nr:rifin [Plasmodium reichenowi]